MHFIFLTLGCHPDLAGGAYRCVAEVAEGLARRAHRVAVICPNPNNALAGEETRAGVSLHRFPNATGFFGNNWRRENAAARERLRRLAARSGEAALIVLCHAYLAPAVGAARRPFVFLFTGPWAEEYRFARKAVSRSVPSRGLDWLIAAAMQRVEKKALRRAGRILTISRYYETQLPVWHGRNLPAIDMMSAGVNASQFHPLPDRAAQRDGWGLTDDDFLFLTVRRLDPRMGLLTLMEAFARVAGEFPKARLWLAGQGPQQPELEEEIRKHGLEERVRLLGFLAEKDLVRFLGAADCTIVPSLDLEGFGLATVESLACGTPALGSRAGATPEILEPLSRDLLFEPGSVAALAAKLKEVLSSPQRLPSRERCREYVLKSFSWERPVGVCEKTWAEFTGDGGRA